MTDFSSRQQKRYLVVVDWVGHSAVAGESEVAVAVVDLVAAGRKWIGGGRTRSHQTPSMVVSVGTMASLLGLTWTFSDLFSQNRDHGLAPGPIR